MSNFGSSNPPDDPFRGSEQVMHIVSNLWQWHYGEFSPNDSWSPAINVYRLKDRVEICMDLAGVDRDTIDVTVQPGQLTIKGERHCPAPEGCEDEQMRILSMEIDHGPFCRTIALPETVDLNAVSSRYDQGILWVQLPFSAPPRKRKGM